MKQNSNLLVFHSTVGSWNSGAVVFEPPSCLPRFPWYTMSNTYIRKSALRWVMEGDEVRMCCGKPQELSHKSAYACLLPCSTGSHCHRLFYLHQASEQNKASILFSLCTLQNWVLRRYKQLTRKCSKKILTPELLLLVVFHSTKLDQHTFHNSAHIL